VSEDVALRLGWVFVCRRVSEDVALRLGWVFVVPTGVGSGTPASPSLTFADVCPPREQAIGYSGTGLTQWRRWRGVFLRSGVAITAG